MRFLVVRSGLAQHAGMDATIAAGLIGAGSAVLSSFLAGWYTLRATKEGLNRERQEAKLVGAFEDILALRDLELRYLDEIARLNQETPDGAKRRMWAEHERNGGKKPSPDAERARVVRSIERYRP